jgi:hypothetical protein
MNAVRWALFAIAASGLMLGHPVAAHHGVADYDMSRVATIRGIVVDYQMVNPHMQITVKVAQDGGDPVEWKVESVALNMMVRAGWKRDSLKPGDAVSITGHPGKNGKAAMLLVKILLPDGQELSAPYE